jgi:NADPH:quinone reductase
LSSSAWAVHTAGASQLGRMMLVIASEMSFPLIHMVRRTAQAELLKSLGAQHVLDTSQGGFAEELRALSAELHATAVFEAIAGEMTGIVLNAMPPKSTVYLYGALSQTPCGSVDPVELIFYEKALTGFFLASWMQKRGIIGVLRAAAKVQRLLIEGRIATTIQRRLSFDEATDGMQQYVDNMTEGKVLLQPHQNS